MPQSQNPNAYIYTKPVLEEAVKHGSVTYALGSAKEAMKWRAHANAYKKAIGQAGPNDFDKLEILLRGQDVIIQTRVIKGKLFVTGNKEAIIERALPEPADPLLDFAKGLAEGLPEVDDD